MIQLGLRAHDFGKLPAPLLADTLREFAPRSIQLALSKALSDSPSAAGSLSTGYMRRLRDIFENRGIRVSVLGCYINPVHPDKAEREKALRRFEEHLAYARDLGCSLVGTETGSCNADCSFHPDTASDDTFDLLCESIGRLVRTAERTGAKVAVEAVAGIHTIDSVDKMRLLIDRIASPALSVIYDPVNLVPVNGLRESQEAFFEHALRVLGPSISAVHAKDFRMEDGRKNGLLSAGTGELDYPSFFRVLAKHKPWIDVLLENGNPLTIRDTIAFIKRTAQCD